MKGVQNQTNLQYVLGRGLTSTEQLHSLFHQIDERIRNQHGMNLQRVVYHISFDTETNHRNDSMIFARHFYEAIYKYIQNRDWMNDLSERFSYWLSTIHQSNSPRAESFLSFLEKQYITEGKLNPNPDFWKTEEFEYPKIDCNELSNHPHLVPLLLIYYLQYNEMFLLSYS